MHQGVWAGPGLARACCPSWSFRHISSLTTVSGARTKDGKGFFGAPRGRLGQLVGWEEVHLSG